MNWIFLGHIFAEGFCGSERMEYRLSPSLLFQTLDTIFPIWLFCVNSYESCPDSHYQNKSESASPTSFIFSISYNIFQKLDIIDFAFSSVFLSLDLYYLLSLSLLQFFAFFIEQSSHVYKTNSKEM